MVDYQLTCRNGIDAEWMRLIAEALGIDLFELLEPVPRLSAEERALIELLRGLDAADRAAVFKVADAMARPTRRAQ